MAVSNVGKDKFYLPKYDKYVNTHNQSIRGSGHVAKARDAHL